MDRQSLLRDGSSQLLAKMRGIFDLESSGRLIAYSALVGIVAGLGAAGFFTALELMQEFCFEHLMGYVQPGAGSERTSDGYTLPTNRWAVFFLPAVGGLVCGWLVYRYAPEAEGHGTDAMVKAFHRLKGEIRTRVPIVKSLASLMTLGTGGSAGREGPIAQIGAGFGSFLARTIGLNEVERRYLMLAGGAAGIGAIFRAPLGGAIFIGEVIYASTAMEFAGLVPAVIASITAYTVFSSLLGTGLAFTTPGTLAFHGWHEIPFYLVFAIICALVGQFYVKTFYGLRDNFFRRLKIPNTLKPVIGGFAVGGIALWLPQIMAGGYGWIQEAIDGRLAIEVMLMLAFAKIIATSFTISSGGSGGVFAPSLFIGAMLGGFYGHLCHEWFPGYISQPGAFVLVGMGGFFAGVAKVPLTALLMVSEMSGSYDLLVPLMLVSIVNFAILPAKVSLYEEQVFSPIDSPAHLGDFVVDILADLRVGEVYVPGSVELIREDAPLDEVLQIVARSRNHYFPVVDKQGQLVGIVSLGDVRAALEGTEHNGLVLATDLMSSPVSTVTPEDDLHTALQQLTLKNIDELPVVDPQDAKQVLGTLSRRQLIASYDRQLARLRAGEP